MLGALGDLFVFLIFLHLCPAGIPKTGRVPPPSLLTHALSSSDTRSPPHNPGSPLQSA